MELFVFLRMGGQRADMLVKPLGEVEGLATSLAKFDAGKAKCFDPVDRQKLWAVIETAFGTLHPFNAIVRDLLADKLVQGERGRGASLLEAGRAHELLVAHRSHEAHWSGRLANWGRMLSGSLNLARRDEAALLEDNSFNKREAYPVGELGGEPNAETPSRPIRSEMLAAIELDSSCSTARASSVSVLGTAPERWMKVQGKVRAVGRLLAVPHSESTVTAEV